MCCVLTRCVLPAVQRKKRLTAKERKQLKKGGDKPADDADAAAADSAAAAASEPAAKAKKQKPSQPQSDAAGAGAGAGAAAGKAKASAAKAAAATAADNAKPTAAEKGAALASMPRGKRSKMKRAMQKHANQDDEDRELASELFGVQGLKKADAEGACCNSCLCSAIHTCEQTTKRTTWLR